MQSKAPSEISYRADIDGLRAVAVLAVIGFHAKLKGLSAGFVGVDIFFVISGFLISCLIIGELKTGSFSFVDFYARRCRRLFPALAVVLAAVWIIAWFIAWPADFAALGKHIAAGAAFSANILLYSEAGYFDAPASTKPLLHLWSLGVEEQFYIFFPALFSLVWHRRLARTMLALLAGASFILNLAAVQRDPAFAFYMPLTRFWEFLAGALLAHLVAIAPYFDGGPFKRLRLKPTFSSVLGLLLILAAFFLIPTDGSFPGWWALLPTSGTLLIIAASSDSWLNRRLLANRALVYVGLISYPLYLWHWPLIVFGNSIMQYYRPFDVHPRTTAQVAVAVAFALAILTYEFIERPIRTQKPFKTTRYFAVLSAACLVPIAGLGLMTLKANGFSSRLPAEIRALMTPITLTDYPPSNDARNSAGPLVVTFGDSYAGHLIPGLRVLQNERVFRLINIGWYCPDDPRIKSEGCEKITTLDENEKQFQRIKPDIVIFGAFWLRYRHIEKIEQTVQFLRSIGVRRIILMGMPPFWPVPPQVLLYKKYSADPSHGVPNRLTTFDKETLEADQQLKNLAKKLGVSFISIFNILCNEDGCLTRLGDRAQDIIQPDRGHFSNAGSSYVISGIAGEIFGGISASQSNNGQ